jgi:hypothetical protein
VEPGNVLDPYRKKGGCERSLLNQCLSLCTYNAKALVFSVTVLKPREWDVMKKDLVDVLIERKLKLDIECDCIGGVPGT